LGDTADTTHIKQTTTTTNTTTTPPQQQRKRYLTVSNNRVSVRYPPDSWILCCDDSHMGIGKLIAYCENVEKQLVIIRAEIY